MDYLALQKPQDYSLFAYSPAIFDYPFDYLVFWYTKRGILEKPRDNQKIMYLIIRDDSDHTYLLRGWYGDKTKDKTQVIQRKEFPGNLILEEHERND